MSGIIGNNIIKLLVTESTNNYASKYCLKENWSEGTIVHADYQENGRGQINNRWESEKGRNLLASVVLYPTFLPVPYQFLVSKVVALAVSDVVLHYADEVSIKWPNDIYIGNKKVAGILVENSIMGSTLCSSIAGIGLNVNQTRFVSDAPNPTSIRMFVDCDLAVEEVLRQLAVQLDFWYKALSNSEIESINQAYLLRMYQLGKPCRYNDADGNFTGAILGVNKIGQLVVEKENGIRHEYHFKEIRFL
jgi:BirA family transcriptional regulator, biotin operon repressor / biotin---[acetyl-CoA-carboxylase] ligase